MHRFEGYLGRGAVAGLAGGVVCALFLRLVTETQISAALRFEAAAELGLGREDPPLVSRVAQEWGGMLAAVLFGLALGVAVAVTVAALHHRIWAADDAGRIARVAAAGFVAVVVVPWLKYPPNPPAVGDAATIGARTSSYLLLVVASLVVVAVAWVLWERLTARGWDGIARLLAGGGAYAVMVGVLLVALPASPDRIAPPANAAAPALEVADDAPPEVLAALLDAAREGRGTALRDPAAPDHPLDPDTVSAPQHLAGTPVAVGTDALVADDFTTVVWRFRLQSLAGLALLWLTLAVVFAALVR